VNVARISEIDLVVIPAIAEVGQDVATPCRCGLQRMRTDHPVTKINDVDILLDENVAGERSIPEPVA